ncbi:MAG: polyprenyl synthetase family protein [Eubacterium sp.]|nr:polyprenyl synthetase family protein [Eubacterium sp.]
MKINSNGYPDFSENFADTAEFYREYFNSELEKVSDEFCEHGCGYEVLGEAMKYSLSAGGKRIRPMLAFEFCRICGGRIEDALPAALAIEMIHTFSLIHDDLPCMDDDDMRRGRPSCHKAYGEAVALLAGDALPFEACRLVADSSLPPERKAAIISVLCECSLYMIGGQTIDINGVTPEKLTDMYALKTSMLIKAACVSGCIAAGADKETQTDAADYAYELGLAFQIIDDILDVVGDEAQLGKPTGSDEKSDKLTYVSMLGLEGAQTAAREHTEMAHKALGKFNETDFIQRLTDVLLDRKK